METWEDNIRHIGQVKVDSLPPGRMATVVFMDPHPSLEEELQTKKRSVHYIICEVTTMETVSRLAYQARDCSSKSQQ